MDDIFAGLASAHELEDRSGLSREGLAERRLGSPDRVFRYAFGRWWGDADLATTAVWVLLNPATGDAEQRGRLTVERCAARSRSAGYSGVVIVNLFAFRDNDPRHLRDVPDAIGPANDEVLSVITRAGAQTIVAWGFHGRLGGRSAQVVPLLDSPMCLGLTRHGEPRHPLSVASDTPLVPWVPVPRAPDVQDANLRAGLLRATPAARERLRAALEAARRQASQGRPVVAWSPSTGEGSTTDPLVLAYPQYDAWVDELVTALVSVNAMPVFDWMSWDGYRRFPRGTGLGASPVADAMRLVTTIVRGERFCDGTIATAVENGSLVAAAERIATELDHGA